MANKFVGFLEAAGKDFLKGLGYAMKYAIPAEKLAAILFPAAAPEMSGIIDATALVQNAVVLIEQKYAAANQQTGTGAQKLADAVTLVGPTVTQLLQKMGVQADGPYIQSIVSAVVAVLNVQQAPQTQALTAVTSTIPTTPGGPVISAGVSPVSGPGVGQQ